MANSGVQSTLHHTVCTGAVYPVTRLAENDLGPSCQEFWFEYLCSKSSLDYSGLLGFWLAVP